VQRGLCFIALAVAGVLLVLFLADLVLGFSGQKDLAPFKHFSMLADVVFAVCSGAIAVMSFLTLKEQV